MWFLDRQWSVNYSVFMFKGYCPLVMIAQELVSETNPYAVLYGQLRKKKSVSMQLPGNLHNLQCDTLSMA